MKVTKELVEKTASLANLEFGEEEIDEFTAQFAEIIRWFEQINTIDTEEMEPAPTFREGNINMREDHVEESIPTDKALKNAPETLGKFFRVPPVIPKRS